MSEVPAHIRNDTRRKVLQITWADGTEHLLAHHKLYAQCPCSGCRSRRQAPAPALLTSDIHITAVHSQGYGVQLVFSNGHDRGIFPWRYLQNLH